MSFFFIIFDVQFEPLTTCSHAAVSRCMSVNPATNIGGGAGFCLSCLALPLFSASCTGSDFCPWCINITNIFITQEPA